MVLPARLAAAAGRQPCRLQEQQAAAAGGLSQYDRAGVEAGIAYREVRVRAQQGLAGAPGVAAHWPEAAAAVGAHNGTSQLCG